MGWDRLDRSVQEGALAEEHAPILELTRESKARALLNWVVAEL